MRRQLAVHRGREVKTMGDGFLATFDGPARAIRCATAIDETVPEIGLAPDEWRLFAVIDTGD